MYTLYHYGRDRNIRLFAIRPSRIDPYARLALRLSNRLQSSSLPHDTYVT